MKNDTTPLCLRAKSRTPWRATLLAGVLVVAGLAQAQSNALNFDAVDDYCSDTSYTGPLGNASRTYEAWIKIPSFPTSQLAIVSNGKLSATPGQRFTLCLLNGIPRVEIGSSAFQGTQAISLNTWHHMATTFDNAASPQCHLYLDGVEINSFNFTQTVNTVNHNGLNIGRRDDGVSLFNGEIDEVRIWDTPVSAADIVAHMNTSYCGTETGLVAYYKFDQGIDGGSNPNDTTLTDLTAFAHDAALHGFALTGASSNWVAGVAMADCSPVTCPAPTQVTITNGTETGFDISWTDTGAPGYEYEVRTSGAAGSGSTGLAASGTAPSGNPATPITGLTTGSDYSVYVRAACTGENSGWTFAVTIHLGYCIPESTSAAFYINNFFTTGGTSNITNTSSGLSTDGYGNFSALTVTKDVGGVFSFTASYVGGSFHTRIWVDWNSDFDFDDAGELAFDGASNVVTAVGSITVPAGTPAGNHRMRIRQASTGTPDACASNSLGEAEDYTVHVTEPVGVSEITATKGYAVHPNPASTTLYIATPNDMPVHVKVYDLVGTLVLEKEMARQLDIAQLATGSYILVATDTQGGNARYSCFMKQ